MGLPAWAAKYVGTPFVDRGRDREGCDCWGLVRLVYIDRFGLDLPSYAEMYAGAADRRTLSTLVPDQAEDWVEVAPGAEREGDVVLLRLFGRPIHVGVTLGGGHFLHTERGHGAVIDSYRGVRWRDRLGGFRRHPALV